MNSIRFLGATAALSALALVAAPVLRGADTPDKPAAQAEAQAQAQPAPKQAQPDPAFVKLMQEISQSFQQTKDIKATGQEALKRLQDYAKQHPKTLEGDQARFIIAQIHADVLDEPAKATEELRKLTTEASQPEARLQAKLALARGLETMDRFDESEALYKALLQESKDEDVQKHVKSRLALLPKMRRLAKGSTPPPFSEKDLNGVVQSPAKHKGKVLLIDFWATWCPPCRAELPNVKAVYQKYRSKGFEILGISADRSIQEVKDFVAKEKMAWPQIADGKYWSAKLVQAYGIEAIPATILLDRKGVIRYRNLRGPDLEAAVAKLVEEK